MFQDRFILVSVTLGRARFQMTRMEDISLLVGVTILFHKF